MSIFVGRGRKARRAYGFDEIALVPGAVTINPNEVDTSWQLGGLKFDVPIIAAAMDGVVDPKFAIAMGKLGGLAVLNLEGVFTRYENPEEILDSISTAKPDEATHLVQGLYEPPIRTDLVAKRVKEIKAGGVPCIVSATPQKAREYGRIAEDAGADVFVVQSTVSTTQHISSEYENLDMKALVSELNIPVIIGNCVTYKTTLDILETGCAGILVGIGPGAACTTRGVLGIGVPQVTATADCAAARDFHYKRTGNYVPVITDGGMTNAGDICKAFACGGDAVMVGSIFAKAKEAPGRGYHWGMATPHSDLPRGTRIRVGTSGTLKQILHGPAELDDGTQNLVGALRTSMGSLGAKNIPQLQLTDIVVAPAIKTEGKVFQQNQRIGMGK